jgi:MFS family permease
MWAPAWGWIVFANVLLGVNQGLAWSMTVVMKIDLAGPRRRGLAMGLNEFAGYLAVALSAYGTGVIASRFGLRPEPLYLGIAFAVAGLALSQICVRDTTRHARHEATMHGRADAPRLTDLSLRASWKDPTLFSVNQAGLVNNLNDGLAWGLFPLLFAASGVGIEQIALLAAVYPGVWGIAQLGTGALSDRWGRKGMIVAGMWLQALGILLVVIGSGIPIWAGAMVLLGLGTALVYPTLLAAVSDVAHPEWRASAVGVYRLWRDGGYAVGGLLAGVLADAVGLPFAVTVVAALTFASGVVVLARMYETLPAKGPNIALPGAAPLSSQAFQRPTRSAS